MICIYRGHAITAEDAVVIKRLDGSQPNKERQNSVDVFGAINLTHFEQQRESRRRRLYCYVSPQTGGMKLKGLKMGKVVKGNNRKEDFIFLVELKMISYYNNTNFYK